MIVEALFGLGSLLVLAAVIAMGVVSWRWLESGKRCLAELGGAARAVRSVAADLPESHPIRRRLEAAPVVEIALEEVAVLMAGEPAEAPARGLVLLQDRFIWVDRFAQIAVHLGLLGTVASLVAADPSNLDLFRSRLPIALGTTLWGLIGALGIGWIGGTIETLLARANREVRDGLLGSLSQRTPRPEGLGLGPTPEPPTDT